MRHSRRRTYLIGGGVGLLALVFIGWLVSRVAQPAAGEAVALMPATHVAEGSDPGAYNTDPPTSGPHYPGEYDARFYEEADLPGLPTSHEGYLVHNLEHGYVIFWYNCAALASLDCTTLKEGIRTVMAQFDGVKLIAFPRSSLTNPLVMTTWGRLRSFEAFDAAVAADFIRRNRYRAPEPNAP
jgi:hypothetical protein